MVMNTGFKSQCLPAYRVLTREQIKHIHCATLELLETVGVKVMHPEALDMMAYAGCRIKPDNIVQIPNWLVEDCIRSAPSRITIYNRLGQEAMLLQGNNTYFGMGTDLIKTYDLVSGMLRESRLADVANAARIADSLEEIDFLGSYALPYDSPTNLMYIDSFKTQLENATKPIFYTAAGTKDIAIINEMAAAVVGGKDALREKPIHIHYAEPLTPLTALIGSHQEALFLRRQCGPGKLYTRYDVRGQRTGDAGRCHYRWKRRSLEWYRSSSAKGQRGADYFRVWHVHPGYEDLCMCIRMPGIQTGLIGLCGPVSLLRHSHVGNSRGQRCTRA